MINTTPMKILKAGTKVKTIVGGIEALVTGVCITMTTIEYRIRWFPSHDLV